MILTEVRIVYQKKKKQDELITLTRTFDRNQKSLNFD